jgi:hypothetical protein
MMTGRAVRRRTRSLAIASPAAVQQEMEAEPDSFTCWFRVAFEERRVRGYLEPDNIATLLQDQPHVHQQPESRDG